MQLLFQILAVAGSAMFAGVMLAIGVILGGHWKALALADFLDWFAQHSELVTMACFVPSNAAFTRKAIALDQVSAKLDTWLPLYNVRIALALAASVLGIVAVNL